MRESRGVEDVLIFAIDGLNGFTGAIEAVYPTAEIQRCIVSDKKFSKICILETEERGSFKFKEHIYSSH